MGAGVDEMRALPFEAVDGPLVGGAVLAHVGDGGVPLDELLVEVELVDERAPWEEVPFDVLHPALNLTLGPSPVRPAQAQPRLEAPILGECLERRFHRTRPPSVGRNTVRGLS